MESIEEDSYDKLVAILEKIIAHLNIIKLGDTKEDNLENAISLLKSFNIDDEMDDNLCLYIYFIQNLFLDENSNFDFEINKLQEYLETQMIKKIFQSLVNELQERSDFFNFLAEISKIFMILYFRDEKIKSFVKQNINKLKNNYECILLILSMSKKSKRNNFFLGSYDSYYKISYQNYISSNLITSIKNNYILLYKLYEKESEEELEDTVNDIQLNVFEYFCNCEIFYEKELKDFFEIFLNFLIERKSLNEYFVKERYMNEKILNNFEKEFIIFVLNLYEKTFEDFSKETIKIFKKKLYKFILECKNKYSNTFLDNVFEIEEKNNYEKEDIAIFSLIYFLKDFIKELEEIADKSDNDIQQYIEDNNLNEQEIMVLCYINENKKNLSKNESEINKEIINKGSDYFNQNANNNRIEEIKENQINELNSEKKIKTSEEDNNENVIIESSNDDKNEISKSYNKNSKELKSKIEELEIKLKNLLKKQERHEKEKEEQKKLSYDLKKEMENMKNTIQEMEKDIKDLQSMDKKMYFKDVSKYYINAFANKFLSNPQSNTYDLCKKILRLNFEKNQILKNLKGPMNKIINHYLEGSAYALVEEFGKQELKNNVYNKTKEYSNLKTISSYDESVGLTKEEANELRNFFKGNYAINSLLKKH